MEPVLRQQTTSVNNSHIDVIIKGPQPTQKSFWHLNITLEGAYLESIGFTPGKQVNVIPQKNSLLFCLEDPGEKKEVMPANEPIRYLNPPHSRSLHVHKNEYIPDKPNISQESKKLDNTPSLTASQTASNSLQNKRHLKIRFKSFPRLNTYKYFPEILLSGKYLEPLGFTIGKKITVLQEQNKLTITVDNPDPIIEIDKQPVLAQEPQKRSPRIKFGEADPSHIDILTDAATRMKSRIQGRSDFKNKINQSVANTEIFEPCQPALTFPGSS